MADKSLWGQKRYPNRYAPFVTPLEIPQGSIFDAPFVCIPLSAQWMPVIMGCLSAAAREDIWQGTDNERFLASQQIQEFMSALVNQRPECEASCMIRVDPLDGCQIQQSLDGGQTWDDIFRLDSCFVTPIVQVQPVEGGNLIQFDMNADSFPEESVFIPDGADGADGAAAPVPIVTISQPSAGQHLVEFDMDANGIPENAVNISDGADGAAAPVPIVTISQPSAGQHLVEFDMDANGIPENAVNIADGAAAPVPIVTISQPSAGQHLVEFDMDANGIPENAVNISDGAAAPVPSVAVNAVEGGNLIQFDMNADSFPEESVFIPDGADGATIIEDVSVLNLPPIEAGIDMRCSSAVHTANQMQKYMLENLDQFDVALSLQSALTEITIRLSNLAGRLGRLGEDYEVFEEIQEVGSAALRATIQSSAWVNDVKCLAYGVLDANGIWDDSKVSDFITAVGNSSIGAKNFTYLWLQSIRLYGISYSARVEQDPLADCSDCTGSGVTPLFCNDVEAGYDWCIESDFSIGSGGWYPHNRNTWSDYHDGAWHSASWNTNPVFQVLELRLNYTSNGGTITRVIFYGTSDGQPVEFAFINTTNYTADVQAIGNEIWLDKVTNIVGGTNLEIEFSNQGATEFTTITSVVIAGTGNQPTILPEFPP